MSTDSIRIYWRRYGPHGGGQWRAKLPDESWVESTSLDMVALLVSLKCEDNPGWTYFIDRSSAPVGSL